MDFPVTPEVLNARHKAYRRERAIVAFFGYSPLLVLYVMTHTSYLRTLLPPSKNLQLLYLVVIPIAWFALLRFAQARIGLARHKLACPDCGHRLLEKELKKLIERSACSQCGASIIVIAPTPI
jgi:hypothetical protein